MQPLVSLPSLSLLSVESITADAIGVLSELRHLTHLDIFFSASLVPPGSSEAYLRAIPASAKRLFLPWSMSRYTEVLCDTIVRLTALQMLQFFADDNDGGLGGAPPTPVPNDVDLQGEPDEEDQEGHDEGEASGDEGSDLSGEASGSESGSDNDEFPDEEDVQHPAGNAGGHLYAPNLLQNMATRPNSEGDGKSEMEEETSNPDDDRWNLLLRHLTGLRRLVINRPRLPWHWIRSLATLTNLQYLNLDARLLPNETKKAKEMFDEKLRATLVVLGHDPWRHLNT
jgi:hypothetical protein